jgi:hypothetical protein
VAFEDIYKSEVGSDEFALDDHREGRTDTDYRMLNSGRRPVYRINIKFFGSLFRKAQDWVGLAPDDCFPLATTRFMRPCKSKSRNICPMSFW